MLSSIFRGNSVIFGATAASMVAGGTVGALFIYGYQHEPTNNEYWNDWWSTYRTRFGNDSSISHQRASSKQDSILSLNDHEYLKLITPRLPRLTCPAQVKSMRFLVPLCGASPDMHVINDFVQSKIDTESVSEEQASQYRLKIIGMDFAKDALELFLDEIDLKEKELSVEDIDYGAEYNFKGNYSLYQIDDDIFSKKSIYKQGAYHLIHCDIFDAAASRLILRADAVYDKDAFSVIHPKLRGKYINMMNNVINRKTKILLVTERFDVWQRNPEQQYEAPFSVNDEEELFQLFGKMVGMERKNIKLLKSIPWTDKQKLKELGFPEDYDGAFSDIWLIQCQSSRPAI